MVWHWEDSTKVHKKEVESSWSKNLQTMQKCRQNVITVVVFNITVSAVIDCCLFCNALLHTMTGLYCVVLVTELISFIQWLIVVVMSCS